VKTHASASVKARGRHARRRSPRLLRARAAQATIRTSRRELGSPSTSAASAASAAGSMRAPPVEGRPAPFGVGVDRQRDHGGPVADRSRRPRKCEPPQATRRMRSTGASSAAPGLPSACVEAIAATRHSCPPLGPQTSVSELVRSLRVRYLAVRAARHTGRRTSKPTCGLGVSVISESRRSWIGTRDDRKGGPRCSFTSRCHRRKPAERGAGGGRPSQQCCAGPLPTSRRSAPQELSLCSAAQHLSRSRRASSSSGRVYMGPQGIGYCCPKSDACDSVMHRSHAPCNDTFDIRVTQWVGLDRHSCVADVPLCRAPTGASAGSKHRTNEHREGADHHQPPADSERGPQALEVKRGREPEGEPR
jgi:hypothetical protein